MAILENFWKAGRFYSLGKHLTPANKTIAENGNSWNLNFNLDPFKTNSTIAVNLRECFIESKASLLLYRFGFYDKSVTLTYG